MAGTAGTAGYVAKWTGASALACSVISESGSVVSIGADALRDTNITAHVVQQVAFTHGVANQKYDIYMTGTQQFWGTIDVVLVDGFSNQNAAGGLRKRFYLGVNPANAIYTNEARYVDEGGVTADNYAIADLRWDGTNSRYYITIVHRVSTGNTPLVHMYAVGNSSAMLDCFMTFTAGAVYTTDTTVYGRPYVTFNNFTGFGTVAPQSRLHVSASEDNQVVGAGTVAALEISNTYGASYGRLSELIFSLGSTTQFYRMAAISTAYTIWHANGISGDILFSTRTTGASALTEKMRISSGGAVTLTNEIYASGVWSTSFGPRTATDLLFKSYGGTLLATLYYATGNLNLLGSLTATTGTFTNDANQALRIQRAGGATLNIYSGTSSTHQWDVYLSGANLRFSDNTSGGVAQFDCGISATTGTFSGNVQIGDAIDIFRAAADPYVMFNRTGAGAQTGYLQLQAAKTLYTDCALTLAAGLTATTGTFSNAMRAVKTADAQFIGLTLRNPSTGTAATTRLQLGNSGADYAFTIDVMGSAYTGDAYGVTILNQYNAVLRLGGYGTTGLTLGSGGAATFAAGLTATSVDLTSTLAVGTYSLRIVAASGASRSLILAGVNGVTNGFTVDYTVAGGITATLLGGFSATSGTFNGADSGTNYRSIFLTNGTYNDIVATAAFRVLDSTQGYANLTLSQAGALGLRAGIQATTAQFSGWTTVGQGVSMTNVPQLVLGTTYQASIAGRYGGGDLVIASNAMQDTSNSDHWVQSSGSYRSWLLSMGLGGDFAVHYAVAGKAAGTTAAFWGTAVFTIGTAGGLTLAAGLSASGNVVLEVGADRYVQIGSSSSYYYRLQAVGDDFLVVEAGGVGTRLSFDYSGQHWYFGPIGTGNLPVTMAALTATTGTFSDAVLINRTASSAILQLQRGANTIGAYVAHTPNGAFSGTNVQWHAGLYANLATYRIWNWNGTADTIAAELSIAGALTLAAGLTATQVNVTGATGAVLIESSTGTNAAYTRFINTGGTYYVGANNSAGNSIGSVIYSLCIYAPASRGIELWTGATQALYIDSSQVADFAGRIKAQGQDYYVPVYTVSASAAPGSGTYADGTLWLQY